MATCKQCKALLVVIRQTRDALLSEGYQPFNDLVEGLSNALGEEWDGREGQWSGYREIRP